MRLLLFDAGIGVLLLATIALAAARRARRAASARNRQCGWLLVALPMPAAVTAHLVLTLPSRLDQALFVAGVVAFAVGAIIVLGVEEDGWSEERGDDSPPWWPAFERDLRDYELLQRQRPKVLQ